MYWFLFFLLLIWQYRKNTPFIGKKRQNKELNEFRQRQSVIFCVLSIRILPFYQKKILLCR